MRITAIREKTVSLSDPASPSPDASREMTASAVAIDVETPSGTVTGYGFSSIGRYAQGSLISERFGPRLLAAAHLGDGHGGFDPAHGWAVMMRREKPGGDGDRAGAVGVLDMAMWDAAAKIADVPLWRLLADRYNGGRHHERVPVFATGGLYHPGGDPGALADEVRSYLDRGYERVKIKCGEGGLGVGRSRIETALGALGGAGDRLAVDLACMCATSAETQAMA
ncbi:MAG: mandelate racemase, partial [Rhodospirillaceae bacterium]